MSENEKFTPPELEKRISWSDLIDSQRQVPAEYKALIDRQEQCLSQGAPEVTIDSEYAKRWSFLVDKTSEVYLQTYGGEDYDYAKKEYENLDQLFRTNLKNGILIDLGGGWSFMKRVAWKYKMGTYVHVDRNSGFTSEKNVHPNPLITTEDLTADDLRQIRVKADMLDCVSRLRPGVVHFTLNGIDTLIIDKLEYHKALAQELLRVSQKGSLIFGLDSQVLDLLSEYAETENAKLQEHIYDELNEMVVGRGRVFEVTK